MTHPGRILIVDDEPKIRSFIGRALASAGYATDFSGNGADAVASALKTRYDLVILDLVMPDLDGRQVLGKLLAARPDQAVIVLSCVADVAAKVDLLERGAQDYLTKPFSLAELLARVRVRLRSEVIRAGEVTLDVARLVADIGGGRCRSPGSSSCCCASSPSTPGTRSPRASCSPPSGATSSTRGPTSSTCASAASAPSWAST